MSAQMSSSSSHTNSGDFGITLHHEGQNEQNSIVPSQKIGTEHAGQQTVEESRDQQTNINKDDVKNNKP